MAGIVIQSANDLLTFMAIAGEDRRLWDAVDIDSLRMIVPVTVKGKGRDGRIDVQGAKLIRDLQSQINAAFVEHGYSAGKRTRLRVAVEDGSDWFNVDFTKPLTEAFRKMSPSQIVAVLVIGAVLATGKCTYSDYMAVDAEKFKAAQAAAMVKEQGEHDERLVKAMAQSNADILEKVKALTTKVAADSTAQGLDAYRPIRRFVGAMTQKETLSVDGGPEFAKKAAVKKLGDKPDTTTTYYVHADGVYSLIGLDLPEGVQGIRVGQDGEHTTALLERLDPQVKAQILATVDSSLDQRKSLEMPLQLDVYFTPVGKKYAVVIGSGEPRKGLRHYQLEEIPGSVPPKRRILPGLEAVK